MRINQFVASATGVSRRQADTYLKQQRVTINQQLAELTSHVTPTDTVMLDDNRLTLPKIITLKLHKPTGYVCSRDGQGSRTIYELLPNKYHNLKPVGRLDKDSSGLLLLTNDGKLAHSLTHPSFQKAKTYTITLNRPLITDDKRQIERGVELQDGRSQLQLSGTGKDWLVTIHEGRNRQIRRTFQKCGYIVTKLHRTHFGNFSISGLKSGHYSVM